MFDQSVYNKQYRDKHRVRILAHKKAKREDGTAYATRNKWIENNKASYLESKKKEREKNKERTNETQRRIGERIRITLLEHYSNGAMKCAQCGCDDVDMLVLDHINDDGAQHKRELGTNKYNKLITDGFPPIVQVMCANCNQKKEILRRRTINESIEDYKEYIRIPCGWYRRINKEGVLIEKQKFRTINKGERKQQEREKRLSDKLIVFAYYSNGTNKCALCGVTDIDVLCIDHINDDGAEDHKKFRGSEIYRELIRQGFPFGLQVYCMNHNHKKEMLRRRDK